MQVKLGEITAIRSLLDFTSTAKPWKARDLILSHFVLGENFTRGYMTTASSDATSSRGSLGE
jgi:hypothetical protein